MSVEWVPKMSVTLLTRSVQSASSSRLQITPFLSVAE